MTMISNAGMPADRYADGHAIGAALRALADRCSDVSASADDICESAYALLGQTSLGDLVLYSFMAGDGDSRGRTSSFLERMAADCEHMGFDTWCVSVLMRCVSAQEGDVPDDVGALLANLFLRFGRNDAVSDHLAWMVLAGRFTDVIDIMLPSASVTPDDAASIGELLRDVNGFALDNAAALERPRGTFSTVSEAASVAAGVAKTATDVTNGSATRGERDSEPSTETSYFEAWDCFSEQYLFDAGRLLSSLAELDGNGAGRDAAVSADIPAMPQQVEELLLSVVGTIPSYGPSGWPAWRDSITDIVTSYRNLSGAAGLAMLPAVAMTVAAEDVDLAGGDGLERLRWVAQSMSTILLMRVPDHHWSRNLATSLLSLRADDYLAAVEEYREEHREGTTGTFWQDASERNGA